MALTPQQLLEMTARRVQRGVQETNFVNTINLVDRTTIDFVWYPGARNVNDSIIDVIVPLPAPGAAPREIPYRWSRTGMADIRRNMSTGRVTLPLAPGTSGTLHAFDTEWRITRPAAGVVLSAANSMQGVQQRLNVLGYHLRTPGAANPGIDSIYARITERAVLSFQVDYRLPAGAPAGSPAGPLRVRGEWTANPGIQVNLNKYNGGPTPNPSGADGTAVQQALVAFVGM
jgi:Putative peptidoglycan binding domain